MICEPKLDRLGARGPAALRDWVKTIFEVGQPWERLAAWTRLHEVVIGTNEYTGRARSLAGSVAESLVRLSPTPVLTVKDQD